MLKKSLLSLAVTTSLVGLAGCNISSTSDNTGTKPVVQTQNETQASTKVYPLFNPARSVLPVGIDLLFAKASTTDGTADVGNDQGNPVKKALNDMDGISTLAPIDVQFNKSIDPTSAVAGSTVFLVKLPNAASVGDAVANQVLPTVYDYGDGEGAVATKPVDALSLATIAPFFATTKVDGTAAASQLETVAARNLFGTTFDGSDPATITDGLLADQPKPGVDYEVVVVGLDGTDDNTIRINPLKPLDSKTKYVVFVTGSVKDASGAKVSPSPDYAAITGTGDLVSPSLAPVRTLVDTLEQLGGQILTSGGTNLTPLADGIVFSAPFTTTDPDTVLKSMAYPGYWAESGVAKNDPTTAAALIATAEGAGLAAAGTGAGLKAIAQGFGLTEDESTVFAAGYMLSGALTSDTSVSDGIPYESPRARSFELIKDVEPAASVIVDQVPLVALNSDTAALGGAKVLVSQGAIELPQYTTTLTDPNAVSSWQGNTDIGTVLDAVAGNEAGTTPPSDTDATKNVTYRFPFAKQQRTAVAPVLFIEPVDGTKAGAYAGLGATDSTCDRSSGKWPVIISQHGFTVHRAGTLLMGAQLAQETCSVVVAMDLPHHGIAPLSTDRNGLDITNSVLGLTVTYNTDTAAIAPFAKAANDIATANSSSILVNLAERHEGLYLDATNTTQAMTWGETKAGKSGDYFIQLTNFQRTRDNNRQAVMDMLNLNATLATIDIDGDDTPDLDINNVSFVGHSLGAITGASFVAVNNDETVQLASAVTQAAAQANGAPANTLHLYYTLPKIKSAVLATPGGGLTKMLENSGSYGPRIIGGLSAAVGIQPGDSSFDSFMKVFQATVDSGDPMNFISDLKLGASSATPTMIIEMIGGGAISATDSNESTTKLSDAFITAGIYPTDHVVPNNTTSATAETARMPLAGTDPMISLLGSTEVTTAGAGQAQAYPVTKFNQGTHGTFSSADSVAVFTEMVTEAATFVGSAGTLISVGNAPILGEAP